MVAFHDALYKGFLELFQSETNTLYKMKELWNYWQYLFEKTEESKEVAKYIKQIRKAQRSAEYLAAAKTIFTTCKIKEESRFEG